MTSKAPRTPLPGATHVKYIADPKQERAACLEIEKLMFEIGALTRRLSAKRRRLMILRATCSTQARLQ